MQVLFVHGMGRTPLSGSRMLRDCRAAGLVTHTFAYSQTVQRFAAIADRLAARIVNIAREGDYVLVGHSLGGVLLRSAFARLPADTRPAQHLFLLGSPVRPARLARKLRDNPLFRLIAGDCGDLLSSAARMRDIPEPPIGTTSITGVRNFFLTAHQFAGEPNDGVVAASETAAHWIDETIEVPVLHSLLPASRLVSATILAKVCGLLKPAASDLQNRRPVWAALSDMFLDTDVSLSREWRVRQLAASPYSIDELEEILCAEVSPVCKSNLTCVAGVWDGFDLDWLEEKILRDAARLSPLLPAALPRRQYSGIRDEWLLTKSQLQDARNLERDMIPSEPASELTDSGHQA